MNPLSAEDFHQKVFESMGSAVNLHYVIGEKNAKLFVMGNQVTQVLGVTAVNLSGTQEIIHFTHQSNGSTGYYLIEQLPKLQPPYTLNVKLKMKRKNEQIKIPVSLRALR